MHSILTRKDEFREISSHPDQIPVIDQTFFRGVK